MFQDRYILASALQKSIRRGLSGYALQYAEILGQEDYNYLIYRLGNLCLLEKAYNNELKNKSYTDKVIIYNKSAFISTKQIPNEYSVWNEAAINNRQQKMGNCAKSIWKIDF